MSCLKFNPQKTETLSPRFYICKNTDENAEVLCPYPDYFKLYFVTKGYATCKTARQTVRLGYGDFCIAPPDISVELTINSSAPEFYAFFFSVPFAEHILQHQAGTGGTISRAFNAGKMIPFKNTPAETRLHFQHLMELLLFEYQTRSPNAEYTVRNCLAAMFCFFPELLKKQEEEVAPPEDYAVLRCVEYIREHYNEPLPLNDMARLSRKQKSDFCLQFKKAVGYSFKDYLNKTRIEKALAMIKSGNGDAPIRKIAEACGYDNYPTFYRNFLKYAGTTPAEYAKN